MSNIELRDKLEALIDSEQLAPVLAALSEVCLDKADHLRSNWQDESTAKAWEQAATLIGLQADAVCV